jgi:hypothetical protein
MSSMNRKAPRIAALTVAAALVGAACGASDDSSASDTTTEVAADVTTTTAPNDEPVATAADETPTESDEVSTEPAGVTSTFEIEVWADNWMAVYVDGEPIGEDSVPITTERSFNKETFAFEASMPFTLAIKAKDFKETDSGIEYIGLNNQQMGDGGIIAQITDLSTGEVVAGTDSSWAVLVVHQAPLNTECVSDADPDSTCEFLVIDTPADWASAGFDDSNWTTATEWSAADVSPKDGYDEISWDESAQLIWGTDLEVDNTVLLRTTVS